MKIFAHLFTYPIDQQLRICMKYNIGCLLTLTVSSLLSLNNSTINLIKEAQKRIPIAIHGPFHDLYPGSIDPYIREATLRRYLDTIKLARDLKAKFVTLHLNYVDSIHRHNRDLWIENTIKLFSELTPFGVNIHIENTKEPTPDIFSSILGSINSPTLGMCLDIGHVVAYSTTNIDCWIRQLSRFIKEIHLHECVEGGDIHEYLGAGLMDWPLIFRLLRNANIDVGAIYLTLEPKTQQDLEKSLQYLRKVIDLDL